MIKTLTAVFLMALVTYIPRALPITLYNKKIKSRFIRSFLYYVPYAVLGAMTFPAILGSTGTLYSSMAGLVTALVLAYFERGLLTVAVGSVLVVYLFKLILKL